MYSQMYGIISSVTPARLLGRDLASCILAASSFLSSSLGSHVSATSPVLTCRSVIQMTFLKTPLAR